MTGPPAQRRRLALLSILVAARGRPVGRERLVGLLWPEHPPAAARRLLSESLYILRKHLGEEVFATGSDDVLLRTGHLGSDLAAFEDAIERGGLEEAARLYRGPFLDGLYVTAAPEFERWAEGERDRLARVYARAVEQLAEAAEARGSPVDAVEWWRRAVACDPYSSRLVLRLMRSLETARERASAIRAFETHASLLRDDLDVEPSQEVLALADRLRAPPHQRETPAPVTPSAPTRPTEPPEVPGQSGREDGPPEELKEPPLEPTPQPAAAGAHFQADDPPASPQRETAGQAAWVRPGWTLAYYGGLFGLIAGFVLSVLIARRDGARAQPYPPSRIAVLYFEDGSPGDSLGYLADGFTRRVVHELTQVPALDVVSLSGVRPYRDREVQFDSMTAQLRAGSIVHGHVMKYRGRIQVIVSLTDANTGSEIESRTFAREEGELTSLFDDVVHQVAAFLRKRVGEEVRLSEMRRDAHDAEAITLVLRAEKARDEARQMARTANARDVASSLRRLDAADSLLVRAEKYDESWAAPVILRGWLALDRAMRSRSPAEVNHLRVALGHAERALALSADSAEILELRGTVLWRWVVAEPQDSSTLQRRRAAEADLERAVALSPNRAAAWITLSQLYRAKGDLAEAEVAAQRAREEDAYLVVAEVGLDRLYRVALALAEYRQAWEWCRAGRRDFPEDFRFWECELTLLAYDPKSPASPDSALQILAALERVDPAPKTRAGGRPYSPAFRQMMLASVLARAGKSDSARTVMARAQQEVIRDPALRGSWYYDAAYVHLLLGDHRRSRALLDTFVHANGALRERVSRDPLFAPLRK